MHQLLNAASRALSQQDAATLESLLNEARNDIALPGPIDMGELARASAVLTAQVHAAERHLGVPAANRITRWRCPWEL